jgi:cbb3-type cytochrome oxidase subunit 3
MILQYFQEAGRSQLIKIQIGEKKSGMKNTLSFKEFLLVQLLWIETGYIWYGKIIFTNLSGMTKNQSQLVLLGIVIGVVVINLIFSVRWSRNSVSAFFTMLTAFGIYTSFAYYKYVSDMYNLIGMIAAWVIIFISLLLLGGTVYALTYKKIKNQKKIKVRFAQAEYSSMRNIVGATAVVAMIGLVGKSYIYGSIAEPENVAAIEVTEIYDIENSFDYNIDMMVGLASETWKTLSVEEKMDILQVLVNIEGRYLGFDKTIRVVADNLDRSILGYYVDEDGLIVINISLLFEEPQSIVKTVEHECRHAAQHTLVRIYNELDEAQQNSIYMYEASVYKTEFENYVDGEESYYQYYAQECESDARSYSEEAVNDIYNRIDEYLQTEKAKW